MPRERQQELRRRKKRKKKRRLERKRLARLQAQRSSQAPATGRSGRAQEQPPASLEQAPRAPVEGGSHVEPAPTQDPAKSEGTTAPAPEPHASDDTQGKNSGSPT